ncbi:thiamine-phosphate kinase [Sneathiella chinensis]|uniref:Thiamine-monophosphate kinase n=1 Tax=Sneathiella chinensis TaxID=349750 RepID=A0ABQ5U5B9_9PROT|nr:thiamine-phosphate kinase [Sneathiella chinensis]GLQ06474.1 thiamine-monophosphate kinase [Sneathiella chinensis]
MTKTGSTSGEFDIIRQAFAPLASAMPGALDLLDDAALLDVPAGEQLVLTKDALVAGVHFLETDAPDLVARKLLRTNLSDLAAMGAAPAGYLLATAWSPDCDDAWIQRFADGLRQDQEEFGIALLGGDTVKTPGPKTFTLTALGRVPRGTALRRGGATAGETVYVSGTIGDGFLGLMSLTGKLPAGAVSKTDAEYLEGRYHLPRPRLALGQRLRNVASACLDVSDGLVADLGHLSEVSGVGINLYLDQVPLSDAARPLTEADPALVARLVTGGDDYELAFTAPADLAGEIEAISSELNLSITAVGTVVEGAGVRGFDKSGAEVVFDRAGWTHF